MNKVTPVDPSEVFNEWPWRKKAVTVGELLEWYRKGKISEWFRENMVQKHVSPTKIEELIKLEVGRIRDLE